jgi:hypothetical protein
MDTKDLGVWNESVIWGIDLVDEHAHMLRLTKPIPVNERTESL